MEELIADNDKPIRFYDFCKQKFEALPSNKSVKKAIENGFLRINGEQCGTGRYVVKGDLISLEISVTKTPKHYDYKLEVVYEDEDFAVINKPAGIPVSANYFKTIANMLPGNLKMSNLVDALAFPVPVHRLDVPTSGLLICAKTITANKAFNDLFKNKGITKTYQALVAGELNENEGVLSEAIDGKSAVTSFKVLKTCPSITHQKLSWVLLQPLTGRTHQLRIHLSGIGCPIIGDKEYGPWQKRHKGLFLSAVALEFPHPRNNAPIQIEIPCPSKFSSYFEREERRWNDVTV